MTLQKIPTMILCIFALLLFPQSVYGMKQTGDVCMMDAHCLNEGQCLTDPETSRRYCECRPGFTGLKCSHYCPYACKNGGYCTLTPEGTSSTLVSLEPRPEDFMCKCFGLWTGPLCEIPYMNCGHRDRCFNGGTCQLDEKLGEHKCKCTDGWSGPTCEAKVDKDDSALAKMVNTPGGRSGVTIVGLLLISMVTALVFLIARRRNQDQEDNFHNLAAFGDEGSTFLEEERHSSFLDDEKGGRDNRPEDAVYNSKGLLLNVI